MRPVICLITDRRRLGPDAEDRLVRRIGAAARAGVHLVQIRERDLDGGPLARLVGRCVAAVRGTPARVLVNDRVDVALAAGAHGVHLRADSMPAPRVRTIVPRGFVIGRSVHGADEAARAVGAGGVDYLIVGTVFATASKPGTRAAGVRVLAEVAAGATVPVLAVGGVTRQTVRDVAATGAAGVAAIGLFADGADEVLQVAVSEVNMAFDIPARVP
jgi:thiamine-phosphate pyrophosphorylase